MLSNPTKEQVKSHGMVFTPSTLVNEMLDKLPHEVFTDPNKMFLDNSCGRGAFLIEVMSRKMKSGASHHQALLTIFGVELDEKNTIECRKLLLGKSDSIELKELLNKHIICADALDPKHPGWKEVGFYWSKLYPDT